MIGSLLGKIVLHSDLRWYIHNIYPENFVCLGGAWNMRFTDRYLLCLVSWSKVLGMTNSTHMAVTQWTPSPGLDGWLAGWMDGRIKASCNIMDDLSTLANIRIVIK